MASISFSVVNFTGDNAEVLLTLEELLSGELQVTAEVASPLGDLRGIFFDIADDTLLTQLTVTGVDVTDFAFGAHQKRQRSR